MADPTFSECLAKLDKHCNVLREMQRDLDSLVFETERIRETLVKSHQLAIVEAEKKARLAEFDRIAGLVAKAVPQAADWT